MEDTMMEERSELMTKTFVFKWGEVTVTLEDIMVVGGYSVLGHSVFNIVDIETDEAKEVLRKLNEAGGS
ncbi:hypothetical protein CTI12_AA245540 [Artemisia annua]|uniref:Aminotransferase-like plant mobile domain-containing protein n=1 Tax=Artemisia annua TaxID=35608 RepID=A0A2U1NNW4_ARTAN|nr:hypothetical protein CTI12_AA245540 [Artemisia annua]